HWERERAGKRWREGRWEQRGDQWVFSDGNWIEVDVRPSQAPPPPREEKWEPRRGFLYVKGRWDWRNGNWEWVPGRWERERAGKRAGGARGEWRDGLCARVDGDGIGAGVYPPRAPPPPRDDRPAMRAGFAWIPGKWDWRNGEWAWVDGHWERERAGQRW